MCKWPINPDFNGAIALDHLGFWLCCVWSFLAYLYNSWCRVSQCNFLSIKTRESELKTFYLTSPTEGCYPQSQKLEPSCSQQQTAPQGSTHLLLLFEILLVTVNRLLSPPPGGALINPDFNGASSFEGGWLI